MEELKIGDYVYDLDIDYYGWIIAIDEARVDYVRSDGAVYWAKKDRVKKEVYIQAAIVSSKLIKVSVVLRGCDDNTRVEIEATEEQVLFLEKLAEETVKVSEYACMPILRVLRSSDEVH